MGDTQTTPEIFDNVFTEIPLVAGVSVSLQNPRNIELVIIHKPTQPAATELGKILLPFKSPIITRGAGSSVWGRFKAGSGFAVYEEI